MARKKKYKIPKYVLELSLKEIRALDNLLQSHHEKPEELIRVGYLCRTILLLNDPCTLLSTNTNEKK